MLAPVPFLTLMGRVGFCLSNALANAWHCTKYGVSERRAMKKSLISGTITC